MTAEALPTLDVLRALEHAHGHLGWLAAAALVHPAILLRNPRRRAPLSVLSATALVTLVGVLGFSLYPSYRVLLKRDLFVQSPAVGYLFERKEHLAVAVIVFAWVGALLHLRALDDAVEARAAGSFAKGAHWAFVASALLALATATLGTIVAIVRTF